MTPSPRRQSCATWALARKTQRGADDRLRAAARGARIHRHAFADQAILADRRGATGSPRYLRSCGWWPIEAKGKMRVRAPIVVSPATLTCEIEPHAVAERRPAGRHGRTGRSRRPRRVARRPRRRRSDGLRSASFAAPASPRPPPRRPARRRPSPRRGTTTCCGVLAMRVMWNSTWSPGTTGLRNFALSIVMR